MKLHKSESTKEQPAEDNYLARIVGISDIGKQPGYVYKGEEVAPSNKIELTYELVTTSMKDGRPFWVSEEVPAYESSKKLQERFRAANVPVGDPVTLLTKPVMVSVRHSEKGWANVQSVAGVPSGLTIPELRNPTQCFDIYDQNPDMDLFQSFSDFKKSKFTGALDFETTPLYHRLAEEATNDIPF